MIKTSPNRCIPDFAIARSKFLTSLGTSDMPRALCENPLKNNKILILFWQEKNDKREKSYHGFWVV